MCVSGLTGFPAPRCTARILEAQLHQAEFCCLSSVVHARLSSVQAPSPPVRTGPAFIKWGQWAATRHDLFPPDMCDELERLHTQVGAEAVGWHGFSWQ